MTAHPPGRHRSPPRFPATRRNVAALGAAAYVLTAAAFGAIGTAAAPDGTASASTGVDPVRPIAHCPNSESGGLRLAAWNGDPSLLAHRYPHLDETPVDRGRIPVDLAADLVSAESSGVQLGSARGPGSAPVFGVVLSGGQGAEVRLSVIGPVPVDVVNVLVSRNATGEHAVLIGLDVGPRSDAPAQEDVPVVADMPTRLVVRDLLARSESADGSASTGVGATAVTATPSLGETGDGGAAVDADDRSHDWILHCVTDSFPLSGPTPVSEVPAHHPNAPSLATTRSEPQTDRSDGHGWVPGSTPVLEETVTRGSLSPTSPTPPSATIEPSSPAASTAAASTSSATPTTEEPTMPTTPTATTISEPVGVPEIPAETPDGGGGGE